MATGAPSTALPAAPGVRHGGAVLARWLSYALDTHISLPVVALLLLAALWATTLHFIDADRIAIDTESRAECRELADTYEAQMARSLDGIDQTLRVLKYAVELNGAAGALPALREQGLLPPGLVFVVAVADRDGQVVASSPAAARRDVSDRPYFRFHKERELDSDSIFAGAPDTDFKGAGEAEVRLHFTRRINDAHGGFAGVAIVEVDPAYFTSAYERSREGAFGLLGLVGSDGLARALRIGDKVSWGQHLSVDGQPVDGIVPGARSPDGMARYLSVRRLHGFSLYAVAGMAVDERMANFRSHRRNWLMAALAASAALALVVSLVSAWSWQLVKARRRVRSAQQTFAAASEASVDAFFVLRSVLAADGAIRDFEIEAINTRAEQMLGLPRHAVCGKLLCELRPHFRRNPIFDCLIKVAREGGVNQGEWQAQGGPVAGQWLHRQVVQVDGGVVAIVRDITERKLAEQRILHMAHHDELTGLPNRALIRDRLEQAILAAERAGHSLAVAFIDLDGFKLVNDGLGHNAGDELLAIVGTRMQRCLRRSDTLGRFGGDEFVIVLPELAADPAALSPLLEQVRLAVTEPALVGGQAVQVSCSMGVSMFPRDGADAETLMMNADAAMYRAKDMGNNNVQFYAREMNESVEQKLILLDGLRNALDATLSGDGGDSQFVLLYQPKVDLRSGCILGVEALVRWCHPEHGMVGPQRFICLAEESGLIVPLGEWVVRTACRQNQAWREAGLAPISISVNVSARQFEERLLVERVAGALCDSGLEPGALELEVTESLIMRDLPKSVGKMRELEAMGVTLSIDDFGTGYSSLSALKSFPISRLKIDKSFVRELATNRDDQAIAMAVISLGHTLNLRVVAEGVETAEQREFLRANDCDEMQGYLFSRPVPAADIARLLAAQGTGTAAPAAMGAS
jgi:diguanylate cyclase (GGDEF)-like protein/PAS domain S-box-containing protein